MSEQPNILLIILDSVRARNCSLYKYNNQTTPFLERFSNSATLFKNAKSPGIHSIASHVSMFSGHHVEEHKLSGHTANLDMESSIWGHLSEECGYSTSLFSPNLIITETSNLGQHFDHCSGPKRNTNQRLFSDAISPEDFKDANSVPDYLQKCYQSEDMLKAFINGVYSKIYMNENVSASPKKERANVYLQEASEWIESQNRPWAVCINLMDAHFPYLPLAEYDCWGGEYFRDLQEDLPNQPLSKTFLEGRPWGQLRALESLYDGCIYQMDSMLDDFIKNIKDMGEYENTFITITSDHGEAFGEKCHTTPPVRLVDHSWGIDEVLTHVPLLTKSPYQTDSETINSISSLVNFKSAVERTVDGGDPTREFVCENGKALASTYRLEDDSDKYDEIDADISPYFGPWRAVYSEEGERIKKYEYHDDDTVILDVSDPQYTKYLSKGDESTIEEFLKEMVSSDSKIGKMSGRVQGETIEHLRDLGYFE